MKTFTQSIVLFLILHLNTGLSQTAVELTGITNKIAAKGPENGRLFLIGGGISEDQARIFQKFAGGPEAGIIVIPTAMSDEEIRKDPNFEKVKKRFKKLNINTVEILHTRNRDSANSAAFVEPITRSNGIFILGGNTKRITDAYLNTRTHLAMKALLERGGIIAGVSAGSGAQASYFFGDRLKKGFQFLEGVIVMNHFLSKNKPFKHIEGIKNNRDRIAIGIDDHTGILVQNKKFEVIGKSYVAVYDGNQYDRYSGTVSVVPPDSGQFYLLQNGDRYNLEERRVETNASLTPLNLSLKELAEYKGRFKAINKDFEIEFLLENDTLKVKNSWGWTIYPIYPFDKDIFYATNRNMWFQFLRENNEVIGVKKMKSIVQEKLLAEMKKKE